jgi:mannose-6-phosphate isomerase
VDVATTPASGTPQLLSVNQVAHFYRGGRRIAEFRGAVAGADPREPVRREPDRREPDRREPDRREPDRREPEEWIGSVTTMAAERERGLSRLPDGSLLRDAVAADPMGWLGPRHTAAYGPSTELLVKLLDAGQRLPVHLHPDRAFARRHLGLPHGKTEAWIILDLDAGARVRLGFTEPMDRSRLRAMMAAADSDGLVRSLRSCRVQPGDTVLVPAGLPHCIDAGVFLLELQEPTDLSILLEAGEVAVDLGRDGHLGLGYDIALDALRLDALTEAALDRLVVRRERVRADGLAALLPAAADPYFRAHRARGADGPSIDAGFAVVVVTRGPGRLRSGPGEGIAVRRGDAAVVPFAAGAWRLDGPVEAVVCRPPDPAGHDRSEVRR